MSSFHFTVRINSNHYPEMYTLRTRNVLSTFSATSDVQYWVNHIRRFSCLAADMAEKQTKLETENK